MKHTAVREALGSERDISERWALINPLMLGGVDAHTTIL
jgi:hypothetical protein